MSIYRYGAQVALSLLLISFQGAGAQAQSLDRYDRRVEVVNYTSVPLSGFFASAVDRATWEEDILGNSMLAPGWSVTVNIDDGSGYCLYDLRAIFADGREAKRFNFNVCDVGSWTIYE